MADLAQRSGVLVGAPACGAGPGSRSGPGIDPSRSVPLPVYDPAGERANGGVAGPLPDRGIPSAHRSAAIRGEEVSLRLPWLILGLVCVALGAVGVVVPGLPTTIFFIGAAACFARSSERLERWVMQLPGVGPAVRDYRDGLGMPRRAKAFAVASIVVFSSLATVVLVDAAAASAVIILVAAVGVIYILTRVPTRERVLAARDKGSESDNPDRT